MEMLIRINAHRRFTCQSRHLAEEGQLPEEDAPENHGPTAGGIFWRDQYINRNYVGNPPAPLRGIPEYRSGEAIAKQQTPHQELAFL